MIGENVAGNYIKGVLLGEAASESLFSVDVFMAAKPSQYRYEQTHDTATFVPIDSRDHYLHTFKRGGLYYLADPPEKEGIPESRLEIREPKSQGLDWDSRS